MFQVVYHRVQYILGPILFLIFINDLPLDIISPLSLFADDSKVFTRIVRGQNSVCQGRWGREVLQKDLDNIKVWAGK